jgi:hypothetical protein
VDKMLVFVLLELHQTSMQVALDEEGCDGAWCISTWSTSGKEERGEHLTGDDKFIVDELADTIPKKRGNENLAGLVVCQGCGVAEKLLGACPQLFRVLAGVEACGRGWHWGSTRLAVMV